MSRKEIKKSESLVNTGDFWPSTDPLFTDIWGSWPRVKTREFESFIPAINFKEDDKSYYVEAELPGLKKEDIDISVKNGNLTFKGEKKTFKEDRREEYHRIERSHGSFYRSISLPADCDTEQVTAAYQEGVLTVNIYKKKGAKDYGSRKINIK